MKKLILALIASLIFQFCAFAQLHRNWQDQEQEEYNSPSLNSSSSLDSFFTAYMSTYHVPGIAACILKNDSIFWEGYYGYANITLNTPATDNTIFNLASISKTIMVTALMQLYEKGYFQLEDSINAYLPFPVRTPTHPEVPITFKMLLTHTSSIQDNWNVLSQLYAPGDPTIPLETFLSDYLIPGGQYYSASQNFYSQIPGTYWSYCNVGAALAGYLVESLTSVPFDEYCKDSIFVSLDMSNTAWFLRDLDTSLVAHPYGYWGGAYHDYGLYGYPDYPDGLLRTTLHSLAKFLVMNIKGGESNGIRLLDTSTVRLIRTVHIPIIPPPWNLYQWGLIWMKPLWSDYDIWGHTGYDDGVTTAMFLRESDDTGVILLTNADGDQPYKAAVDRLFDEITVGIKEELVNIPKYFIMMQNYPNPFNSSSVIKYSIPEVSKVMLKLFNLLGEEVVTLVNEEKIAGNYTVEFDAANLPSGVYFYQLKAGSFVETKKMILLR